MLTKREFLAAIGRETRILTHLASRLQDGHLGFRFTPPQRSTLELLQYLTINAEGGLGWFLNANWDHWDALDARAKAVTLASFPGALKTQQRNLTRLLKPVSDKAFLTRRVKSMMGRSSGPLAQLLQETVLTTSIGYRMQLFLQAKAAGLADLCSSDLWAGKAASKAG